MVGLYVRKTEPILKLPSLSLTNGGITKIIVLTISALLGHAAPVSDLVLETAC